MIKFLDVKNGSVSSYQEKLLYSELEKALFDKIRPVVFDFLKNDLNNEKDDYILTFESKTHRFGKNYKTDTIHGNVYIFLKDKHIRVPYVFSAYDNGKLGFRVFLNLKKSFVAHK